MRDGTDPRRQRPRPRSLRCTYGVVAAQRAPNEQNGPTPHVPNLCCAVYDGSVPAWHCTDCDLGVANGAGTWRCTAGVTPASTRTRDRGTEARPEARTGPSPLYHPQWQATTRSPGNLRRHHRQPPQRPADGQQRAALRREGDWNTKKGPRGLISPSRRMFSTAPVGSYPLVLPRDTGSPL